MLTEKAKEVFKKEHPIRSLFPVSINFYRKWFESKGYFIFFTDFKILWFPVRFQSLPKKATTIR